MENRATAGGDVSGLKHATHSPIGHQKANEQSMTRNLTAALFGLLLLTAYGTADDWPQWRGPQRDGVWRETGLVESLPDGQLPLDWSIPLGSGYAGPTVAGGRVYVMDRTASDDGSLQNERILCVSSKDGSKIWEHVYAAPYKIQYTAGPRASVTIDRDVAYAVGAMGHMFALDARTGNVLWQHDLNAEYDIQMPIWGIAAAPLIYRELVIQQVGGSGAACMVAFDRSSGKEVWKSLTERAAYSSPIIVKQAGQDVLVCWTGDALSGLDPQRARFIGLKPCVLRVCPSASPRRAWMVI